MALEQMCVLTGKSMVVAYGTLDDFGIHDDKLRFRMGNSQYQNIDADVLLSTFITDDVVFVQLDTTEGKKVFHLSSTLWDSDPIRGISTAHQERLVPRNTSARAALCQVKRAMRARAYRGIESDDDDEF